MLTGLNHQPSLEGSRQRQEKSRAIKNEAQEQGRQKRLAGRAYRQAMKSDNIGDQFNALQMLEKINAPGRGGSGAGVSIKGNEERNIAGRLEQRLQQDKSMRTQGQRQGQAGQPGDPQVQDKSKLSFDEMEKIGREKANARGAFSGSSRGLVNTPQEEASVGSVIDLKKEAASSLVSRILSNEGLSQEGAETEAIKLGGTKESLQAAVEKEKYNRSVAPQEGDEPWETAYRKREIDGKGDGDPTTSFTPQQKAMHLEGQLFKGGVTEEEFLKQGAAMGGRPESLQRIISSARQDREMQGVKESQLRQEVSQEADQKAKNDAILAPMRQQRAEEEARIRAQKGEYSIEDALNGTEYKPPVNSGILESRMSPPPSGQSGIVSAMTSAYPERPQAPALAPQESDLSLAAGSNDFTKHSKTARDKMMQNPRHREGVEQELEKIRAADRLKLNKAYATNKPSSPVIAGLMKYVGDDPQAQERSSYLLDLALK